MASKEWSRLMDRLDEPRKPRNATEIEFTGNLLTILVDGEERQYTFHKQKQYYFFMRDGEFVTYTFQPGKLTLFDDGTIIVDVEHIFKIPPEDTIIWCKWQTLVHDYKTFFKGKDMPPNLTLDEITLIESQLANENQVKAQEEYNKLFTNSGEAKDGSTNSGGGSIPNPYKLRL